MSKFVGFSNFTKDIPNNRNILSNMLNELKDNPEVTKFDSENFCLGGFTTYEYTFSNENYIIALDGTIFNIDDLKIELKNEKIKFDSNNMLEILLLSYICFGYHIFSRLNGSFAFIIWNNTKKELLLIRDQFGTKPLYYTYQNDTLVFTSNVNSIFKFPNIDAILDKNGISELFGISPAHTPGTTLFKNIEEIKPAHFLIFNKCGLFVNQYWNLKSKTHIDNLEDSCENIRFLLKDSIEMQLNTSKPICTFLSGGLDSSIITYYASKYYENKNLPPLNTFSVDYVDNDKNFVKNDFQPNSDNYYINIMKNNLKVNHKNIILDTPELINNLENSMLSREFPGMADVDSSLLLFCKSVKPYVDISLTGECSDEIFAGYPWFFREDLFKNNTFPWSLAIEERQKLLNPVYNSIINLNEYINCKYYNSLNEINYCNTDSLVTVEKKKISHLTINWFMNTLIDRSERMANYSNFEIRVPFCDYRLVEYLWNIPWDMKSLNNREKGLLRYAMKDILPQEIIERKKSPYPKTHNPNYLSKIKNKLNSIINYPNVPLKNLYNIDYIKEIIEADGDSFSRPWFGQLMTGPQLMAYLCQVNMWLEKYQPKIEI